MASAERLPSRKWRGLYRDAEGRKQRVPGTFSHKAAATEAAREAEVRGRRQASADTGDLSAKTTWEDWWQIYWAQRDQATETGITERKAHDNILEPRWGKIPLNRIEHHDVQAWVDDLARKYASTYVRRTVGIFSASVNAAMRRGILSASPVAGLRQPKRLKTPKSYVSIPEFETLAPHLPESYRDAVEFLLETGMRPGELAGLHVHRVDETRQRVWISDVYVRRQWAIRSTPKNGHARSVPLTVKALEIVQRRLEGRDLKSACGVRHLDNKWCTHPLVFLNAQGGVMNSDILQRRMNKAAKAAGLEPKNPYAARRGYATRLADAGLDTFQIQRLLGHADIEESEGYVQESPVAAARTLEALGDAPRLRVVGGETSA